MSDVKLNLEKLMADDATKGNLNLSVRKVTNGIIVNCNASVNNPTNPEANENSSGEFVYKGTAVEIKNDIDAELGIGGFFLDGTEA